MTQSGITCCLCTGRKRKNARTVSNSRVDEVKSIYVWLQHEYKVKVGSGKVKYKLKHLKQSKLCFCYQADCAALCKKSDPRSAQTNLSLFKPAGLCSLQVCAGHTPTNTITR